MLNRQQWLFQINVFFATKKQKTLSYRTQILQYDFDFSISTLKFLCRTHTASNKTVYCEGTRARNISELTHSCTHTTLHHIWLGLHLGRVDVWDDSSSQLSNEAQWQHRSIRRTNWKVLFSFVLNLSTSSEVQTMAGFVVCGLWSENDESKMLRRIFCFCLLFIDCLL